MNNSFKGIPFSHEDEIHEHREILLVVFTRFCKFSKEISAERSPITTGKNGRLKLATL